MKKLLLLLLCVPLIGVGQQRTYVPDTHFEKKLISLGLDETLDDYVLTGNINDLEKLNVRSCNISDLTGIRSFTALTHLDCWGNGLTSLDVSNNTALTDLQCSNNQLTSLDISNNTALTTLYCNFNQLTSLDVSNNTALKYLYCINNKFDCDALKEMLFKEKGGVKENRKVNKKVKLVVGCMDDGENLPSNVTVTNYNPDATYNYDCKYSTPLVVKNNYMFCTDDPDGTFDGCSPEEAKGIMDGYITPRTYKVIADTPTRVNNIRTRILNIVTTSIESHNDISYIPLRNENKFTKAFNQSLIDDITNALTVSVVETQFKRSEDDPAFQVYPFTYVTVYSPQGATDPITEFKIKRNTAIDAPVGITGIVPWDAANTFRKRLANIPGVPTVPPNLVNKINNHLVRYLKIKDIKFNNEGILQDK